MKPKFKVWDKEHNKFVSYGDRDYREWCVRSDGNIGWISKYGYLQDGDRELVPVMSTGLKDRNGKEIYEGDILCIENYYHDYQDGIAISEIPDNRIEPVYWDVAGMWMTDNEVLVEVCAISEVIGNIYENPELLTDAV